MLRAAVIRLALLAAALSLLDGVAGQPGQCSGETGASCAQKGCDPVCGFNEGDPCQCDAQCEVFGECCADFDAVCRATTPSPTAAPTGAPTRPPGERCSDVPSPCGPNSASCSNVDLPMPSCEQQCAVEIAACSAVAGCDGESSCWQLATAVDGFACTTASCVMLCAARTLSSASPGYPLLRDVAICLTERCLEANFTVNCTCNPSYLGDRCAVAAPTASPSPGAISTSVPLTLVPTASPTSATPTALPSAAPPTVAPSSVTPTSAPSIAVRTTGAPSSPPPIVASCNEGACHAVGTAGCVDIISGCVPSNCDIERAACAASTECIPGLPCLDFIGGSDDLFAVRSVRDVLLCANISAGSAGAALLTVASQCLLRDGCSNGTLVGVNCTCRPGFDGSVCNRLLTDAPTAVPSTLPPSDVATTTAPTSAPTLSPTPLPSAVPTTLETCADHPCAPTGTDNCTDLRVRAPPCSTQCAAARAACVNDPPCNAHIFCLDVIGGDDDLVASETVEDVLICGVALSGDNVSQRILRDAAECYINGCVDTVPAGFACSCQRGWTGVLCADDVDECTSLPLPCNGDGTCHNLGGTYTCTPCPPGFTGEGCTQSLPPSTSPTTESPVAAPSGRTSIPTQAPTALPSSAPTALESCSDTPCFALGTQRCTNLTAPAPNCSVQCSRHRAACDADPSCRTYLICLDSIGGDDDLFASETVEDVMVCGVGLQNTASQQLLQGAAECYVNGCVDHVLAGFACTCTDGWVGIRCSSDVNECASLVSPCGGNGTCRNTPGGYTCEACPTGFSGENCTVSQSPTSTPTQQPSSATTGHPTSAPTPIETCANSPCFSNGTANCTDLRAPAPPCPVQCAEERAACGADPACQVYLICLDTIGGDDDLFASETVEDVLVCGVGLLHQHNHSHTLLRTAAECYVNDCVETVPSGFACNCTSGWQGARCATDVDECAVLTQPCNGHGHCQNEAGSYSCIPCAPGLTGEGCTESLPPTHEPTPSPTSVPSPVPSTQPSPLPTVQPTFNPTAHPTARPTFLPTAIPTAGPVATPTNSPTNSPTLFPSTLPTQSPTAIPSPLPSGVPTLHPTARPTLVPSSSPSFAPSLAPSALPTTEPTSFPSAGPTLGPTTAPSAHPSTTPSASPSALPTVTPTVSPTQSPVLGSTTTAAPTVEADCLRNRVRNDTIDFTAQAITSGLAVASNTEAVTHDVFTATAVVTDISAGTSSMSAVFSVPPLAATTASVSIDRPSADVFDAVIQTDAVFEDARSVITQIQLRDDTLWSTTLSGGRRMRVEVVDPAGQSHSRTGQCENGGAHQLCQLTVTLPTSVFASTHGNRTAGVFCGFESTWPLTRRQAGSVDIVVSPGDLSAVANLLSFELPKRDLNPGDTFNMNVISRFSRTIDTFQLYFEVGVGLQIEQGIPGAAGGDPLFAGTFAVVTNATHGGRVASSSFSRRGSAPTAQPNEVILSVAMRVTSDASAGESAIVVFRTTELTDANSQMPRSTAMRGRGGVETTGMAQVHFGVDAVQGIFATVEQSDILAIEALTGVPFSQSIAAVRVMQFTGPRAISGADALSGLRCTSQDPSSVLATNECTMTLPPVVTGTGRAVVNATYGGFTAEVPLRVLTVLNMSIQTRVASLRPVAGWFDESVADGCSALHVPTTQATASITYGVNQAAPLATADVTAVLAAAGGRWESSNIAVATVSSSGVVSAAGQSGTATLRIVGHAGVTAVVAVDLETPVSVVRLDASAITRVTASSVQTASAHAAVRLNVVRHLEPLQFEGEEVTVVAAAVLSDGVRVPLTHADGLQLESLAPLSVSVSSPLATQRIGLVTSPEGACGALARAVWAPNNCSGGINADGNITIDVDPPPAIAMAVTVNRAVLVPQGGPAAAVSGYDVTAQVFVSLEFPQSRFQRNVQADSRTHYTVEWLTGNADTFALNTSTGTIVTAEHTRNRTGVARITVTFDGQNVSDSVDVRVTNYWAVSVVARPSPTYSGSSSVVVRSVHPISGVTPEQYEEVRVEMRMHLMAGSNPLSDTVLPLGQVQFSIVQQSNGIQAQVDSGSRADQVRIVTASAEGTVTILGIFTTVNASVLVEVSQTAVEVTSVQTMRLSGAISNTVRNFRGTTNAAQVTLGVVLSNGRQIPQAVRPDGTITLPGLFTFTSSVPSVLTVDAATGAVTLLDNHHSSVTVSTAITNRGSVPGNTVSVFCNLIPRPHDVDLGASVGAPIPSASPMIFQDVDVVVNTGAHTLGAYRIEISYNSSAIEFDSADFSTSLLTGAEAGTSVDATDTIFTGSNARVLLVGSFPRGGVRGAAARIARLRVRATTVGVHELSGIALLQSNTVPVVTFANDAAINAGRVRFLAASGRLRNRRSGSLGITTNGELMDPTTGEQLPLFTAEPRYPRRSRRQAQCTTATSETIRGDVDCNCAFQPGDALYVHKYVAAVPLGFQVSYGQIVENTLSRCPHTRAALDADQSGVIDARDASLLLRILAQQTLFVDVTVASTRGTVNGAAACHVNSTITASTDSGGSGSGVTVYGVISSLSPVQVQPAGSIAVLTGTELLVPAIPHADGRTYTVAVSSRGETTAFGVSVLLVVSSSTVPQAFFYGGHLPGTPGAPSGTPFPTVSLDVPVGSSGQTVRASSFGSAGYFARGMIADCANLAAGTIAPTTSPTFNDTTTSPLLTSEPILSTVASPATPLSTTSVVIASTSVPTIQPSARPSTISPTTPRIIVVDLEGDTSNAKDDKKSGTADNLMYILVAVLIVLIMIILFLVMVMRSQRSRRQTMTRADSFHKNMSRASTPALTKNPMFIGSPGDDYNGMEPNFAERKVLVPEPKPAMHGRPSKLLVGLGRAESDGTTITSAPSFDVVYAGSMDLGSIVLSEKKVKQEAKLIGSNAVEEVPVCVHLAPSLTVSPVYELNDVEAGPPFTALSIPGEDLHFCVVDENHVYIGVRALSAFTTLYKFQCRSQEEANAVYYSLLSEYTKLADAAALSSWSGLMSDTPRRDDSGDRRTSLMTQATPNSGRAAAAPPEDYMGYRDVAPEQDGDDGDENAPMRDIAFTQHIVNAEVSPMGGEGGYGVISQFEHGVQTLDRHMTDQQATPEGAVASDVTRSSIDVFMTVNVKYDPGAGLGLGLEESPYGGVRISVVKPGTPAANLGTLSVGDHIDSVNGQNVSSMKARSVGNLIDAAQGDLELGIRVLGEHSTTLDMHSVPPPVFHTTTDTGDFDAGDHLDDIRKRAEELRKRTAEIRKRREEDRKTRIKNRFGGQ